MTYHKKTYTIKARAEGWRDKLLDVGVNEAEKKRVDDGTGAKKLVVYTKPIVDGAALPVRKPWPLGGQGGRKPSPTDSPAELEFVPYKEMPWAPLAFK